MFGIIRIMSPAANPPRRRGAPAGNTNAVKSGFYSKRFKKSERDALETKDFKGLTDEIALLRLFIHRVISESLSLDDPFYHLEVLRVISLASSSLSRLVRIHTLLFESSAADRLEELLNQATTDALAEMRRAAQDKDYANRLLLEQLEYMGVITINQPYPPRDPVTEEADYLPEINRSPKYRNHLLKPAAYPCSPSAHLPSNPSSALQIRNLRIVLN